MTLHARLNSGDVDSFLLRKLARLSRDTPLSDGEASADIWENGDRFGEVINALFAFFEDHAQVVKCL